MVTAHSDKQDARPTSKRGYGYHPLWVFADHGSDGTGEPLAVLLRPGNAGSNGKDVAFGDGARQRRRPSVASGAVVLDDL